MLAAADAAALHEDAHGRSPSSSSKNSKTHSTFLPHSDNQRRQRTPFGPVPIEDRDFTLMFASISWYAPACVRQVTSVKSYRG
ncbi:uncharacterized protein CLUP02_05855 [Colletotrichum lupini]|uniref:Uncharacterized protein n=1 Tax=Colletotrichum lupini TaxID=145971 RepID=A0A9Q8SPT5_9PEZI|nr:uncharacterized protein CLUP02_05855 [Colletotrichum lupini]UQC80372.1 hypothetical protein CLUP02_05855 [Colletotrichum lupini]